MVFTLCMCLCKSRSVRFLSLSVLQVSFSSEKALYLIQSIKLKRLFEDHFQIYTCFIVTGQQGAI